MSELHRSLFSFSQVFSGCHLIKLYNIVSQVVPLVKLFIFIVVVTDDMIYINTYMWSECIYVNLNDVFVCFRQYLIYPPQFTM